MAESNNPKNDDLFYGIMLAVAVVLIFLPFIVVKSAQVAPERAVAITTRRALGQAAAAAGLAAACAIALWIWPEVFQSKIVSLGHLSLRLEHVGIWSAANLGMFAVVYGSLPYWQRFLPKRNDLRTGLY